MGLPVMPASESVEIDRSLPPEMVIREIRFLKKHKVTGSNGLSRSVFEDNGAALMLEFTKLMESTWERVGVHR